MHRSAMLMAGLASVCEILAIFVMLKIRIKTTQGLPTDYKPTAADARTPRDAAVER